MPRESPFNRLVRHFHEHPRGRLHELAFWWGLALVLGGGAFLAWWADKLSDPLALIAGIVALCMGLFSLLPQRKGRGPPPLPPGKRGAIAAKVRASKAERKKKNNVPPPPIRRG